MFAFLSSVELLGDCLPSNNAVGREQCLHGTMSEATAPHQVLPDTRLSVSFIPRIIPQRGGSSAYVTDGNMESPNWDPACSRPCGRKLRAMIQTYAHRPAFYERSAPDHEMQFWDPHAGFSGLPSLTTSS